MRYVTNASTTQRLLAREVLVHGELVDVRLAGRADGCHRRPDALGREAVEVGARLPEVEHAPAAVHGPGGVEDQPLRGISVRVDHGVELVEQLRRDAVDLDSDADCHCCSCQWTGRLYCSPAGAGRGSPGRAP